MELILLLNELPTWQLLAIVVGFSVIFSVTLQLAFRRWLGTEILSLNNEVAGFKFAVVGVSYAVLLAFVMVVVWEDFRSTDASVRREAEAIRDLHQISFAMPDASATHIRSTVFDYAELVRSEEWRDLAEGRGSQAAEQVLFRLTRQITNVEPVTLQQQALYSRALVLVDGIADSRSERIDGSQGTIPPVLWVALVIGGLITLSYTSFFASPNPLAQVLMTVGLAVTVALIFSVSLALNYPFTGQLHISSAPIDAVVTEMTQGQ